MAKDDDLLKTKKESIDDLEFNSNSGESSPLTNKVTGEVFGGSSGVIDDVGGISNFNVGTDIVDKQEGQVQNQEFLSKADSQSSVDQEVEQIIFNEIAGIENQVLTPEQEQFVLNLSREDRLNLINQILEVNTDLELNGNPLEIFDELNFQQDDNNRDSDGQGRGRQSQQEENVLADELVDEIEDSTVDEPVESVQFSDQEASDATTDDINLNFSEDSVVDVDIKFTQADTDGSEVVDFTIFDIPEGSSFSNGVQNDDGSWSLSVEDLTNLQFTPPEHFSGEINLTVLTTNTELASNDTSTSYSVLNFNISGVADEAKVEILNVSGDEDNWIRLDLDVDLTDTDGSETLSITLENLPDGSILSNGSYLGEGRWSVSTDDLDSLNFLPPNNFSGEIDLSLVAITTESDSLDQSVVSKDFSVFVDSVVDSPVLEVQNITLNEDNSIALNIDASLVDTDGSEVLSIHVEGLPEGSSLSNGIDNGDGSWILEASDLDGLTLSIPTNSNEDFSLKVTATATEQDSGESLSVESSFNVDIVGVADKPIVEISNAIGQEDQWIQLDIKGELQDTDWSETLSFIVSNVPDGARFSPRGTDNGDGTWSFTEAQAEVLCIRGPHNSDEDFSLEVVAVVTENDGDQFISEPYSLDVQLNAVADSPSLSVSDSSGLEDSLIYLDINSSLFDSDGSENLEVIISNIPDGVTFNNGEINSDGNLVLSVNELEGLGLFAPENSDQDFSLNISSTSVENENGDSKTVSTSINVSVQSVADEPVITIENAAGLEDKWLQLDIKGELQDTDGSESLSFIISNVPEGAQFSPRGVLNEDGSYSFTEAQAEVLCIKGPSNSDEDFTLDIVAVVTESDGNQFVSESYQLEVDLVGVADGTTLSANNVSGNEDELIYLNIDSSLIDSDGSEQASVIISDIPSGVEFNKGELNEDGNLVLSLSDLDGLGLYPSSNNDEDFSLTVTSSSSEIDGGATKSITTSFNVTVEAVADEPVITIQNAVGNEDEWIQLDIKGELQDLDGSESLSFVISNVPDGVSFSPGGIKNDDGTYSFTEAQAEVLCVKGAANSDEDLSLDIVATVTEENGATFTTGPSQLNVSINAVADTPTLIVEDSSGETGSPISIDITSSLTDLDGSEELSVVISNVPSGHEFNQGTNLGDGSWSFDSNELEGLTVLSNDEFGSFDYTVTATSVDGSDSKSVSSSLNINIEDSNPLEGGELSAGDVSGKEDRWVKLDLDFTSFDTDSNETTTFLIEGVPDGYRLRGGKNLGDGQWQVSEKNIDNVRIRAPKNNNEDIELTVSSTTVNNETGETQESSLDFAVEFKGVVDRVNISRNKFSGQEDSSIDLDFDFKFSDNDGSENIQSVVLSKVPDGATLSSGEQIGKGKWLIDLEDMNDLSIIPPENSSKNFTMKLSYTVGEDDGATRTFKKNLKINVDGVADDVVNVSSPSPVSEGEEVDLNLQFELTDTDGSERVQSVIIDDLPEGSYLTLGSPNDDGSWTVEAKDFSNVKLVNDENLSGDFELSMNIVSSERYGSKDINITEDNLSISIDPVADAPELLVEDSSGKAGRFIDLDIESSLTDLDGSESLSIFISGVPEDAYLNTGQLLEDGRWELNQEELDGLQLRTDRGQDEDFSLSVEAVSTESNGESSSVVSNLDINIEELGHGHGYGHGHGHGHSFDLDGFSVSGNGKFSSILKGVLEFQSTNDNFDIFVQHFEQDSESNSNFSFEFDSQEGQGFSFDIDTNDRDEDRDVDDNDDHDYNSDNCQDYNDDGNNNVA